MRKMIKMKVMRSLSTFRDFCDKGIIQVFDRMIIFF